MIELISETEAAPASYPDISNVVTISSAVLQLDSTDHIWERIESWCRYRWTERDVEWIVSGPGEFVPLLEPATITAVEKWSEASFAYVTESLDASPLGGYWVPGPGHYRFTATIALGGVTPVPRPVLEAFRRLVEYSVERDTVPGSSSFTRNIGEFEKSVQRAPSWMARAMHNSGAADLLRPYRRNK